MVCPKCGKDNPDHANYCYGCGNKIGKGASGDVPKVKNSTRPAVMIAGIVGGVAVVVLILTMTVIVPAFKQMSETKPVNEHSQTSAPEVEVETEIEVEETETASSGEFTPLPVSAQDDGNLFGNTHCYARMVSDGTKLYFRNPLDSEKTYVMELGSSTATPLGEFYMKDMHFSDGWLYYCRTSKDDISGEEPDRNLYRVKPDGTGNQRLTDITYGEKEAWLSFDTIVDGKCYFTYSDGIKDGYHIAEAAADGSGFRDLYFIEPSNCKGLPTLNVVDGNIYYKANDGLNCLNIASGTNSLVAAAFDCEEYIIYGGEVYYSVNANQGERVAKVRKMKLDGTEDRDLFVPSSADTWMQYIQVNIYRDKLYFIGLLEDPHTESRGRIYTSNLDGTSARVLVERATWFNIVNDTLYYRYVDDSNPVTGRNEPFYGFRLTNAGQDSDASEISPQRLFDTETYNYGWIRIGENWYYYDKNHQMIQDQWLSIDGKDYCFAKDGTLYVNTTTPDGKLVGEDGTAAAFFAGYVDAVNKNRGRQLYLSNEGGYGSNDKSRSEFIDHGSYYEVTNGCILVDTQYDRSVMNGKGIGDTIQLKNGIYRIERIETTDFGREYISLEFVSGEDSYFYTLSMDLNEDYYTLSGDSDATDKESIYSGSLYFSKDCTAEAFDMMNDWVKHTVSFKDYATQDHELIGAEHGVYSSYGLILWGDFTMDSTGLITHYDEYFVS